MRTGITEIQLEFIETREMTFIKVEAVQNKTIWNCIEESIVLAKLLKCAVHLYFNDEVLNVYANSTLESVIASQKNFKS